MPSYISHLNLQRDNFPNFFPNTQFIFMMPEFTLKYFLRRAPDFFDWRSGCHMFKSENELNSQRTPDWAQGLDENTSALFSKAYNLAESKCFEEAIWEYDHVLSLEPENPDALYNRGYALTQIGHYDRALEDYQAVVRLQPDAEDAQHNLQCIKLDMGLVESPSSKPLLTPTI